jgi:hypothetical protein
MSALDDVLHNLEVYNLLPASVEDARIELEKLRLDASGRYIKGGEGSHWDGCEETHFDCKIAKLEKENAKLLVDLEDARDIINHGVKLMPLDQLGKWEGVRAWLELSRYDDLEFGICPVCEAKRNIRLVKETKENDGFGYKTYWCETCHSYFTKDDSKYPEVTK